MAVYQASCCSLADQTSEAVDAAVDLSSIRLYTLSAALAFSGSTNMSKVLDAVQRFRKIEEATAAKDDPAPGKTLFAALCGTCKSDLSLTGLAISNSVSAG